MVHVSNEGTKKRRVLDFLAAGNTLTTVKQSPASMSVTCVRPSATSSRRSRSTVTGRSTLTLPHLVRPSTGWTSLVMMITHSPSESVSAN